MKLLKSLCLVLAIFLLAGCSKISENTLVIDSQETTVQDRQIIPMKVGETTLRVEAVTSPESITLGLGQRDEIGSDGMLFVMPQRGVANFWMHGMRFPLDMIWIDGNTIVGITKNVPAPENPASTALPTYSSEVPVTHVLELPAGKADELALQTGMVVE